MTIEALVDKQDTFEIIRDQIATILVNETASQQALATAGGKDPDDWKIRVYLERADAWEQFLNPEVTDTSPICNIWVDGSDYDPSDSNIINNLKAETTYNIDIYGYGLSEADGSGQIHGDEAAAFNAQRGYRLVRNWLYNEIYTYLDLPRGTVFSRWFTSFRELQPEYDGSQVQNIVCIRAKFRVDHRELTAQQTYELLEIINIEVKRAEDGQLLAQVVYDFTT